MTGPPAPADTQEDWRAPDRGIESRMALAIGLVIAGYILVVGLAFTAAWWFGILALCIAAGLILSSAKSASALLGAREVTAAEEARLVGIVESLCALEGRRTPRVMVAEDPTPNAFAVG